VPFSPRQEDVCAATTQGHCDTKSLATAVLDKHSEERTKQMPVAATHEDRCAADVRINIETHVGRFFKKNPHALQHQPTGEARPPPAMMPSSAGEQLTQPPPPSSMRFKKMSLSTRQTANNTQGAPLLQTSALRPARMPISRRCGSLASVPEV